MRIHFPTELKNSCETQFEIQRNPDSNCFSTFFWHKTWIKVWAKSLRERVHKMKHIFRWIAIKEFLISKILESFWCLSYFVTDSSLTRIWCESSTGLVLFLLIYSEEYFYCYYKRDFNFYLKIRVSRVKPFASRIVWVMNWKTFEFYTEIKSILFSFS